MSDFLNNLKTITFSMLILASMFCTNAAAQRARFPDFFSNSGGGIAPNGAIPQGSGQSIITTPGAILQPPNLQQIIPSGINQSPVFQNPNLPNPQSPIINPTQVPNQPFPIFPRGGQPSFQPPIGTGIPQGGIFPQGGFQQPNFPALPQPQSGYGYGSPQVPNRWPYEGTGSNWLPSVDWTWPQEAWRTFRTQFLPRVLERPRARQTYLHGSNGNELNINDIEIATTATIPNFLRGTQPLRISPGFIFHWWDGPDSSVYPAFDLPSRAYSAYLSFDHITNPANTSGFESNFTVGFYSDFDNTSSDGIRLTSKLLAWQRLNPYIVGKLGIEYLDRVDVKMLPAVGLYMTPNPDMKLDLYFPRPKLSHRVPNIGDFEAWMYVGGEYGGGSWAIDRRDGTPDQVDINDVRAFLGIEWMGPRRVTGFFEFGYAFDREIIYRSNALNVLDLQDTLMVRSGLAF